MKTFYIQSFYQYPVTFSSIGKTIPARNAVGEMKNIAEVSENELSKLRNCEPFFRELENKKKLKVLNHIPASYVPPAQQINAAHEEADKYKSENEALRARIAELEAKQNVVSEDVVEAPVTETTEDENKESDAEVSAEAKSTKKKTNKNK